MARLGVRVEPVLDSSKARLAKESSHACGVARLSGQTGIGLFDAHDLEASPGGVNRVHVERHPRPVDRIKSIRNSEFQVRYADDVGKQSRCSTSMNRRMPMQGVPPIRLVHEAPGNPCSERAAGFARHAKRLSSLVMGGALR